MTIIAETVQKSTQGPVWGSLSAQLDQAEAQLDYHRQQFKYHVQMAEEHRQGYEVALREPKQVQKLVPYGGRN